MQPITAVMSPYPKPGEVVEDKYRVEQLLGEGGMGAVARATHLIRQAPVALKFMSPMVMAVPGAIERFLNEGVAASRIDSDHVVKIFDVGKLPLGAPYLVMECLDGEDIAQLLLREGAHGIRDIKRCLYFAIQILSGLQVAHDAGVVHRDMKPSNCFLVHRDGEPDFVKILDFGISKVTRDTENKLTQTNSTLGTPLYMSPEQARSARSVDARTDLYSTGVILFELLTGRTPFASETGAFTEVLYKIFTTDPPPIQSLRTDIPQDLANAINRSIARDPADRYANAAHMAEALAPWTDDRCAVELQRIRRRSGVEGSTAHRVDPARTASPHAGATVAMGSDSTLPVLLKRPAHPESKPHTGVAAQTESMPSLAKPPVKRSPLVVIGLGAFVVGVIATVGWWGTHRRPTPTVPEATKELVVLPSTEVPVVSSVASVEQPSASSAPSASAAATAPSKPPQTMPPVAASRSAEPANSVGTKKPNINSVGAKW